MANICNTTYKIYDRVDGATARLFNVLKIFFDSGDIPLDELAEKFKIDIEEKNICARGYIYNYYFCSDNCLLIETESAWTACNDLFNEISKVLDNGLIIDYREIEVGCQVFNVKNTRGSFPEKCCVSASGNPFDEICEGVFDTIEDAISYWCEQMQYDRKDKSESEMLEIIEDYEYQNEDTYFNIYEFDFLNE
jgi:hypothetical protein